MSSEASPQSADRSFQYSPAPALHRAAGAAPGQRRSTASSYSLGFCRFEKTHSTSPSSLIHLHTFVIWSQSHHLDLAACGTHSCLRFRFWCTSRSTPANGKNKDCVESYSALFLRHLPLFSDEAFFVASTRICFWWSCAESGRTGLSEFSEHAPPVSMTLVNVTSAAGTEEITTRQVTHSEGSVHQTNAHTHDTSVPLVV
jgi:hypothetical protein